MSSAQQSVSPGTVGETKIGTEESLQDDSPATGGGYWQFAAQAAAMRAKQEDNEQAFTAHAKEAQQFRANAIFSDDEWKTLDDRLLEVADSKQYLIDQLRSRGLSATTDLSTLIYEYEKAVSDESGDAQVSMGLETRGQDELPVQGQVAGIPIPIVHKSYHLNNRTLRVSSRSGNGINTRALDKATEGVTGTVAQMLYQGWDGQVDGYSLPGLLTEANRNRFGGTDWSDTASVGYDEIRGDILTAIETLENDNYEPEGTGYVMYLDRSQNQQLRRRKVGTDNRVSAKRELEDEFGDILTIEWASDLPTGESVMLRPTQDVVEVVVASDLQNVEWSSHAGFTSHMKVMASITPLVKSDTDGQSGIVHFSTDGGGAPAQ